MRLLIVHSSAELYGSDRSLLDFVRLRPRGLDAVVMLPARGPLQQALEAAGAEVVVGEVCKIERARLTPLGLLQTAAAAWRAVRFLSRLHRRQRFDLVYSNSVAVLGGALCARLWRVPHVWHVREILVGSAAVTTVFRRMVGWLAARVVCNSGETLAWIRGRNQQESGRYVAIWNGYDLPVSPTDRLGARQDLGASADDVLFVLVGRVNAWKGQGLLVQAFSDLVRTRPELPVRLALVGSAFAGQEHFEHQLQAAIAASGCADRICWQRFRPDVEQVWAAADVVVVPSTDPEPFGRVALEAMAFCKPVLASAHGGLIEIVQHEVTGLLVPPRDAAALTAAMARLAADKEERLRLGLAGRRRQLAHFSVRRYVDRVVAQLQLAVSPQPVQAL